MHSEPITAAMLANYLRSQVTGDTPVVLTGADFDDDDGGSDFVALDDALNEINMEPERYQQD